MKYEVVIAGAGPAGLSAAAELALHKKKVLVLEKNKEIGDKICAGGLTTRDFSLGLPKELFSYLFKESTVHTRWFKASIKQKEPFIATIERKILGQWMMQKVQKTGAEIKLDTLISKITDQYIETNNHEKIKYQYLIGADGANSLVRRFLKISSEKLAVGMQYLVKKQFDKLEIFYNGEIFGPCYAWIFPHKNFDSVGVVALVRTSWSVDFVKNNFHIWLKQKGIDLKGAIWQTHAINYDYQGWDFGKRFLVGDAGGFTSGFTGEGIYNAIISGKEAARKIIDPNYAAPELKKVLQLKKWQEHYLNKFLRHPCLISPYFEIGNFLFKFKYFQKKAIYLFC